MIEISSIILSQYIDMILAVCPKKDVPLYRAPSGALLALDDGELLLTVTNGYSMLECKFPCISDPTDKLECVIPLQALQFIKANNKHSDITTIEIVSDIAINIIIGGTISRFSLLDRIFPNYQSRMRDLEQPCSLDSEIGLCPKLLSSFISKIKSDIMIMHFHGNKHPVFITSPDYRYMTYVCMPIELEEY